MPFCTTPAVLLRTCDAAEGSLSAVNASRIFGFVFSNHHTNPTREDLYVSQIVCATRSFLCASLRDFGFVGSSLLPINARLFIGRGLLHVMGNASLAPLSFCF